MADYFEPETGPNAIGQRGIGDDVRVSRRRLEFAREWLAEERLSSSGLRTSREILAQASLRILVDRALEDCDRHAAELGATAPAPAPYAGMIAAFKAAGIDAYLWNSGGNIMTLRIDFPGDAYALLTEWESGALPAAGLESDAALALGFYDSDGEWASPDVEPVTLEGAVAQIKAVAK